MTIVKCQRCPQMIVFLPTARGSMPVNAETVALGDVAFDASKHVSHFATCPAAAEFRKRKPIPPPSRVFRG